MQAAFVVAIALDMLCKMLKKIKNVFSNLLENCFSFIRRS